MLLVIIFGVIGLVLGVLVNRHIKNKPFSQNSLYSLFIFIGIFTVIGTIISTTGGVIYNNLSDGILVSTESVLDIEYNKNEAILFTKNDKSTKINKKYLIDSNSKNVNDVERLSVQTFVTPTTHWLLSSPKTYSLVIVD